MTEDDDRKPRNPYSGSMTVPVAIPADRTVSGKEKTVEIGFRWELQPHRLPTARDWREWEIRQAREKLAEGREKAAGEEPWQALRPLADALHHAVNVWCRAHFRGRPDNLTTKAFYARAPEDLRALVKAAWDIYPDEDEEEDADYGLLARRVEAAVAALLEAARHPPEKKPPFPGYWDLHPAPPKPDLEVGDFIDTGHYRPAEVIAIAKRLPYDATISYGDEVDRDFSPPFQTWRKVPRPDPMPSLKDVFAPDDWIKVDRRGYGRITQVRDVRLLVTFPGERSWLFPGPELGGIEKVDGPQPRPDLPPLSERFPIGSWIRQTHFGEGLVLGHRITHPWEWHESCPFEHDVESLGALFADGAHWVGDSDPWADPTIMPLDRPSLDLSAPWAERWRWFWLRPEVCDWKGSPPPCPCCGYPNFGKPDNRWSAPARCLLCGWWDGGEDWQEPERVHPRFIRRGGRWRRHLNGSYSLKGARRRTERRGHMFRLTDWRAWRMRRTAAMRAELCALLDQAVEEDDPNPYEFWNLARALAKKIAQIGESR